MLDLSSHDGVPRKGSVITQEDIAKAAGVSRMTVSYAMRNSPMVSRKTCERIQKLAEEMGYRPNPLVSSLMRHLQSGEVKKVHASIAFVVWGFHEEGLYNNPSLVALYEGAKAQAEKAGYRIERYHIGDGEMSPARLHEVLLSRGTHGLLCVFANGHDLTDFDISPFACATYGYTLESPSLHRVCAFHLDMIQQAGLELRKRGYERIGMMINSYIDERLHIFRGAYHALRVTLGVDSTAEIGMSDGTLASAKKYIKEHHLDGVLLPSLADAERLVKSLKLVPKKLGVAVLENDGKHPQLAGMSQNNRAIGSGMVDLVVGQLNRNQRGVPEDPKTVLISSVWQDGESVRRLTS